MQDLDELDRKKITCIDVLDCGFVFHTDDGEKLRYKIETFNSGTDSLVANPYQTSSVYTCRHTLHGKPDGSGISYISYDSMDYYEEEPRDEYWRVVDSIRFRERSGNFFYVVMYSIFPSYKSKDFIEDVDHRLVPVDALPEDTIVLDGSKDSILLDICNRVETLEYCY